MTKRNIFGKMKRMVVTLFLSLIILIPVRSMASLITYSDIIVHDDVSNLYWMRDLSSQTLKFYGAQLEAISTFNSNPLYSDPHWTNWRMATESDLTALQTNGESAITDVFLPSHTAAGVGETYSGYYNNGTTAPPPIYSLTLMSTPASQPAPPTAVAQQMTLPIAPPPILLPPVFENYTPPLPYTEAVESLFEMEGIQFRLPASAFVGAWIVSTAASEVPEPASIFLFGLGILGLAGVSRRRK